MSSYDRMARVIRWLAENAHEQPSLAEMAAASGLGVSHFHREFVRWTGVTPKDFVQCLTLRDARARLERGQSVFDSAVEAGLSGPGRLHDLCVSLEASTPGEIGSGGAGMKIRWGRGETLFGTCEIAESRRGICGLSFVGESDKEREPMQNLWPLAEWLRDDLWAQERLEVIFSTLYDGEHKRVWLRGSPFQLRVWRALLEIPPGALTTYGRLAAAIGCQGAARAVGTAVGANPIACLIPCHRVIRETGKLSGYRWGADRKRAILAWEGALCSEM